MRIWIFVIAAAVGTVAHFLYAPLGKPRWLALFLPVSESPWEHAKLVFWPLLGAVGLLAYREGLAWPAAVTAGFVGAMHAIAAMLGLHYAVRFGFADGSPILWVDILTFFLSLGSGYAIALGLLEAPVPEPVGVLCGLCLLVLACFFQWGSLNPPPQNVFQDGRKAKT